MTLCIWCSTAKPNGGTGEFCQPSVRSRFGLGRFERVINCESGLEKGALNTILTYFLLIFHIVFRMSSTKIVSDKRQQTGMRSGQVGHGHEDL